MLHFLSVAVLLGAMAERVKLVPFDEFKVRSKAFRCNLNGT